MNANRHPNQNWRKRWAIDAETRTLTHVTGLAVTLTAAEDELVWAMHLAAGLPAGYNVTPSDLQRVLYEGLRAWQEMALDGEQLRQAVLPWTKQEITETTRVALLAQWRTARGH